MAVATFDYSAWSELCPDLAKNVSEAQAQFYFDNIAPLYLDNSDYSIVKDVNKRSVLLMLLVAHIAQLSLPTSAGGSGVVGRVSSATKGSVSIGTDYPTTPNAAWYNQTQWGSMFWTATAYLRQARYVRGFPQRPRIWP